MSLQHCSRSVGGSSVDRARTERSHAMAGQISCSPSTTATRSARACLHVSQSTPVSRPKTCRALGRVTREKLGWVPEIGVREMRAEMVAHDLDQASRHALAKRHEYEVAVSSE